MTWQDSKMQAEVRRTVKAHCANFKDGGCLLLDGMPCLLFRELMDGQEPNRCTWFEDAVLANSPALEVEYNRKLAAYLGEDTTVKQDTAKCQRCRKPFVKKSNSAKFCDECKVIEYRRSKAKASRQYRRRKASKTS